MTTHRKHFFMMALTVCLLAGLTGCGERVEEASGPEPGTEISAKQLIEEDGTEYSKADGLEALPEPESLGAELKEASSESAMIVEEPFSE